MRFSVAMALILTGCVTAPRGFPPTGSIQNFDLVSPALCRGAQPNVVGLEYLASIGVKTVVNLRGDPWLDEERECARLGMRYANIPLSGTQAPNRRSLEMALRAIEGGGRTFVHCQAGCDRTGTVVACWRIRHGEKPEAAVSDMMTHGTSVFEPGMISFVRRFQ